MLSVVLTVALVLPSAALAEAPASGERSIELAITLPNGQKTTETLPPKGYLKLRGNTPRYYNVKIQPTVAGDRVTFEVFRASEQPGQADILAATVRGTIGSPFSVDVGGPGKPLTFTFTAQWRPPAK